jgi:hypothetical protein
VEVDAPVEEYVRYVDSLISMDQRLQMVDEARSKNVFSFHERGMVERYNNLIKSPDIKEWLPT